MKARKSVSPVSPELQELRLQRQVGRSNRLVIADALQAIHRVGTPGNCKSHVREATIGLFAVIEEARRALLNITGAPGVIWQDALRECCEARGDFSPVSRIDPLFCYLRDKLHGGFEAGYLVEPGDFQMKRNLRSGSRTFVSLGSAKQTRELRDKFGLNRRRVAASKGAKIETPTASQLQVWFDLPSEVPPTAA